MDSSEGLVSGSPTNFSNCKQHTQIQLSCAINYNSGVFTVAAILTSFNSQCPCCNDLLKIT